MRTGDSDAGYNVTALTGVWHAGDKDVCVLIEPVVQVRYNVGGEAA